ncbi:hypothetical protein UA08_05849 [Talaromyces atroroseus]|uniref:Uncharacterized protein n=1 Tax=Talaromyces atroroseus TaxID=1441469 RepID=A0A225ATZ9_TALAT|nr:hypothetical protein UA08_05849 [Talaromyces atroroseus]OKL59069.1 hypothetical protein UA08_05849 [Talaromyces atroroseus]
MSHPYLISKIADPLFALLIGSSSAYLRIQRDLSEEKQQSTNTTDASVQSQTQQGRPPQVKAQEIWSLGARRVGMWWRGEFSGLK